MTRCIAPMTLLCLAITTGSASAAQVWQSTFDATADGVVDIYDNNPAKATIGANTGGKQELIVADSTGFALTDRAGRPLGATLDGHSSYSGLATFMVSSLPPTGQTWNQIGFSGSGGSNPGVARQVSAAFFLWNHDGAGDVTLNLGLQWGSSSGQDRTNIAGSINLGPDANVLGQTFQLAISYRGDFNGLTNSVDTGTGMLRVDLYDGGGTLLKSVVQNNITAGDGGGQVPLLSGLGGEPGIYPTFLANQQLTHLGVLDYVGTVSGRQVVYAMDSLAYYDTFDGAINAVVPEPSALVLAALGLVSLAGAAGKKRYGR